MQLCIFHIETLSAFYSMEDTVFDMISQWEEKWTSQLWNWTGVEQDA